jgi:ABC-2 type transport system ATP-binding protein
MSQQQTAVADSPEMSDVVVLDKVSKSFGGKQAVREVSIVVRRGEVFGFLGPNGAGKSTTIRMILDVLRPTKGSISLFGEASRRVVSTHKRLGFLSGDMVMDNSLTGRQYLVFVAAQYGKDCRQNMERLAGSLQADLNQKIGNYSRGNRQKIGLIAALQHEPELLILDEPTSGFDPLVQEQFAELIVAFKHDGGTVFMSSHILSEVQQLCDRVAFIKDGQIIDTTTVEGLTAQAAKRIRVRVPVADLATLRQVISSLKGVQMGQSLEEYTLEFGFNGDINSLLKTLTAYDIQEITIKEPELEEIFRHYYQAQVPAQGADQPPQTAGGSGVVRA